MPKAKKTYRWDGDLLRAAREEAGLSRTQLAAACDVTEATVRSWESGATAPYLPTFLLAAVALDRDPESLLGA